MKKILSLLLALTLIFALVACGSNDEGTDGGVTGDSGLVSPGQDANTGLPEVGGEGGASTETPEQPATGSGNSENKPVSNQTSKPSTGGSTSSKPATGGGASAKPSTGGTTSGKPSGGGSSSAEQGDLAAMMDKLIAGSTGEMKVVTEEIASDAFKANLFIEYIDGAKAVSSSAMMSSIAHSVCLLKLPEGTDAAKVAEEINKNKDPRKWICVEAEKAVVLQRGNYILLAMSQTSIVDTVTANFTATF